MSVNLPTVCAILCPSLVLRQEAVARLQAQVLTVAADFNCDVFRAGEADLDQVLRAAHTLPMMAPRRWVHLTAVQLLRAEAQQALAAYVADPVPTTVFCFSGERLDQRMKLALALKKAGALQAVATPRPHELSRWLQARAQSTGARLQPDAAALLVQLAGPDLDQLMQELEKARLYAGAKAPVAAGAAAAALTVDLEAVGEAVAATRLGSVFELTHAMGERAWAPASQKLRQLLQGGEAALMLLAMIVRHWRQLLQVKESRGGSVQGVPPFALAALQAQARRFSSSELTRGLQRASATDIALKSSRLPAELIMERLLLDLV